MAKVEIKGLKKAKVLKALYDNSKYQGISFLGALDKEFTEEMAEEELKKCTYFDYLHGKVMKINLSSDEEFDGWLYDRDNGEGVAQKVIDDLRKSLVVSGEGVYAEIVPSFSNRSEIVAKSLNNISNATNGNYSFNELLKILVDVEIVKKEMLYDFNNKWVEETSLIRNFYEKLAIKYFLRFGFNEKNIMNRIKWNADLKENNPFKITFNTDSVFTDELVKQYAEIIFVEICNGEQKE